MDLRIDFDNTNKIVFQEQGKRRDSLQFRVLFTFFKRAPVVIWMDPV